MSSNDRGRRNEPGLWTAREATEEDKYNIMGLFSEVFGQEMTQDLWYWKYGHGRGCAVIAERHGEVIAHYGGIRRTVVREGREQASIQCVDTMVKPSERGTLSRKGPYFLVASEFLDRFVGCGRPFEFGFGFPNKRVMRVGEILGVQASVGEILEPVWSPVSNTRYYDETYSPTNAIHRDWADILWSAMRDSLSNAIVGVRDHEYLKYRYFENPLFKYDVVLVMSENRSEPVGLTVSRQEGKRVLLLDLIGNVRKFPELVDHVRFIASVPGCRELRGWITENYLDALGSHFERVDRPEVLIPTSTCTEGPSVEELRGKWWLTAGDAEFK
jgi:hypothetical protein